MSDMPTNSTPELLSGDERNWAVLAHLSSFIAAWFALGILGPIVVYFAKGADSAFVKANAREAINFNITALIGIAVSVVLIPVFLIGLLPLVVIGVLYLVFTIKAAMAASDGRLYRYPLTIRFIN